MKGDFTRDTFSAEKQYQAVLMQQGRAQLDADWNEQAAITTRRDETTARDIVGCCGGPKGSAAFGIVLHGPDGTMAPPRDFYLSAGRYYVDGIQCELEEPILFSRQKNRGFLDEKNETIRDGKSYLLYLDVWRRHVTALEDQAIRETALGGPDTATRVQTVWQARLLELANEEAESALCNGKFPSLDKATAAGTGTLTAYTSPEDAKPDPCSVPASAGYTGLENQLYRVEIHEPGTAGKATYKWSRDNGTVAAALLGVQGNRITVSTLGPDEALGFAKDQWVELIDDTLELERKPGQLVRIADIPTGGRTIVLAANVAAPLAGLDSARLSKRHARVRRWDGTGTIPAEGARKLESGIMVRFSADVKATYLTGDYWLIPARAATAESLNGAIEWPREEGEPASLRPHGIQHHYCRLGLLKQPHPEEKKKRGAGKGLGTPYLEHTDCRCLWSPLTVPRLDYVGGDGQEVMPDLAHAGNDPPTRVKVPQPLSVRVTNMQCGGRPLSLRFRVTCGSGILWLIPTPPVEHESELSIPGVNEVTLRAAAGIVSCDWYLDPATLSQQVEVALVDEKGTVMVGPLLFNAGLNVAKNVAYLPEKCKAMANAEPPVRTVHDAIEFLCQQKRGCCEIVVDPRDGKDIGEIVGKLIEEGRTDICLCLLGGAIPHKLSKGWKFTAKPEQEIHLRLAGCGRGARIALDAPLQLEGLASLTLRDLEINASFVGQKLTDIVVAVGACSDVTMTGCRITGIVPATALVGVGGVDRFTMRDTVLEAGRSKGLESYVKVLDAAGASGFSTLFSDCGWPGFKAGAEELAAKFFKEMDAAGRAALGKKLVEVFKKSGLETTLSRAELQALLVLGVAIVDKKGSAGLLVNALIGLRTAALRAAGADALVIVQTAGSAGEQGEITDFDAGSRVVIEECDIIGHVSLNGLSSEKTFDAELLGKARELFTKEAPNVVALGGTLQLRGNRLTRLMVSSLVVERVSANIDAGRSALLVPFSRNSITDNVVDGAGSLIVTGWLTMTGNQFTLSAESQQIADPKFNTTHYVVRLATSFAVALACARQAVFVGNQCSQPAALLHADHLSDQAANVGISV